VRVRQIALFASLYVAVPFRGPRTALDAFWRHSVGAAYTAEIIIDRATRKPPDSNPEVAFLAGLLHDIALLVPQSHYPAEFRLAHGRAEPERTSLAAGELAELGTDHGDLGALIARHWSLPDHLISAIRLHHRLELAEGELRGLACVVHLADAIWAGQDHGNFNEGARPPVDPAVCRELGIEPDSVGQLGEEARQHTRHAAAIVG
jgi:HD-like signal output (HDOD) protein